jgi:acetyl esterase/lipase
VAFLVAVISAFLVLSASTALRPGRKGLFATLAFPVGWAAGELPAQAIVIEAGLLGLLAWWGWPRTAWLSLVILVLAAVVAVENLTLVAIAFYSRGIVRRAMREAPVRPLEIPQPRDDVFGSWWRTALQIPYHPRDMQLVSDVAYGPARRHRLDVWRMSTTPKDAPVIFYIHGGAWTYGDKREQGRPMLHEFVRRGWVAVVINYRLAPRHPWPAQIEDATLALYWIKRTIQSYGGDPDRVVVSGGSAGGHLAALLALSSEDPAWHPANAQAAVDWSVRGAMPFYGVLEMTGDDEHWRGLGWGIRRLLENHVVQQPYLENESVYRQLSPYERIHVNAPPFLVVQGGNDTLVDVNVARAFVERFRHVAFAPAYYIELPFTQHAFDVTASPRTSATTRAAVAFAESVAVRRPRLDGALVANYQVPPTQLRVRIDDDWLEATRAAREFGPLKVLTSDNPYSRPLDEDENASRRSELLTQLRARELTLRESETSSSTGQWPVEEGFALIDTSVDLARAIARAWDQFAIYEVDEHRVVVRSVATGEVLA